MTEATNVFELVEKGDIGHLRAALEQDPGLASARNDRGVPVIMFAAYQGRKEAVDLLRAGRSDFDLCEAATVGDVDRITGLLSDTSTVVDYRSADGFTPLQLACFFANFEAAERLADAGADVEAVADNPMRIRPVHAAAASNRTDTIQMLLDHGADPNSRQHGGFTALHAAAQHRNDEMVAILLARGADITAKTDDGKLASDYNPDDPRLNSQ